MTATINYQITKSPHVFDKRGVHAFTVAVQATNQANTEVPSWEHGARQALDRIGTVQTINKRLPDSLEVLNYYLDGMRSQVNSENWDAGELHQMIRFIGAEALIHVDLTPQEIVAILAEKQAAYGTQNILAFGLAGIHVRISDKIARLNNLLDKGRDETEWSYMNEPLSDTLLDLVGYAVISGMIQAGTFEHPLLADIPNGQVDSLDLSDLMGELEADIIEALNDR